MTPTALVWLLALPVCVVVLAVAARAVLGSGAEDE
jgi:hypothetical protein